MLREVLGQTFTFRFPSNLTPESEANFPINHLRQIFFPLREILFAFWQIARYVSCIAKPVLQHSTLALPGAARPSEVGCAFAR